MHYTSIVMKLSNCVKIFKALSNEQRLKIFLMIRESCCSTDGQKASKIQAKDGTCCPVVGVIEKAFTKVCGYINLSRSTVSHHFKELQNAGLITCERDGQTYRCRVNEEAINTIKDFLK